MPLPNNAVLNYRLAVLPNPLLPVRRARISVRARSWGAKKLPLKITMKPPLPPFTLETATAKVQAAEDAWNTRDPKKIALAYSTDTRWRNRSEFLEGRQAVAQFLQSKWHRELDYRLKKTLWSVTGNHIAVKFEYEYHNADAQWFRAYGNELWEFASDGLMQVREASINDLPIMESDRKFRWERSS